MSCVDNISDEYIIVLVSVNDDFPDGHKIINVQKSLKEEVSNQFNIDIECIDIHGQHSPPKKEQKKYFSSDIKHIQQYDIGYPSDIKISKEEVKDIVAKKLLTFGFDVRGAKSCRINKKEYNIKS